MPLSVTLMSILALHAPNLHLPGARERGVCRATALAQIDADLARITANAGARLHSFVSKHEGPPIDRLHAARDDGTGHIVINPGGPTHLSLRTTAVT